MCNARTCAHTLSPRYPSGCNKSPLIPDDRCYGAHTAGRWNELRASLSVRVGSSFTYRKIRNARLFLAVLSARLAGNIERGIMIFAEGDTKSKMYADISHDYSYRILGTGETLP